MTDTAPIHDFPARPGQGLRSVPWVGLLACMFAVGLMIFYWYRTRLPASVTIAGGPENGRYAQLAEGLADELEDRLGIRVVVRQTKGSLENLRLLETHDADLGFYQPGTRLILEGRESGDSSQEPAQFISNLYPEFMLPVRRSDDASVSLNGIRDQIWCSNDRLSGDFAVTRILLQHLGLDESSIDVRSISYKDLPNGFKEKRVNIGILCCGLQAPILRTLLQTNQTQLVPVPAVEALARKHTALTLETVPQGYFQTNPPVPAENFPTVALQAQLLADRDAPVRLIEEVTRIVTNARFQRRHGLTELFAGGIDYATNRPEYELHLGAAHIHYPGLKPLLNPDFVEGTEGLRSFIVSLVAALWLLHRWWTRRQLRSQEHRLDRYIRELLQLERAQMEVDGEGGPEESGTLQRLLDRVTILRQEALAEFTAHELNEDRAVDCFIEMCHALSDKINAKLTRHVIRTTAAARN